MLTEGVVVGYGVEGWWVEFGECGVGVLAVKALLEAVDPESVSRIWEKKGGTLALFSS